MLNYKTNVFLAEDKKPDSEGKVPVRFYVNVSGERITKHVGIRVRPRDWNSEKWQVRKSDSNYRNHNETIRTTISEVEAKIQEAYNQRKKITPALVKQLLNGKAGTDDFWKYTEGLMLDMEKKFSASHLVNFNGVLKRLKEFAPQFYFAAATPAWLRKYESFLLDGGLANNTIHKHFKLLKKIFNSAIREGVTENYPFRNYDNPKYKESDRTYLTAEETEKIEAILKMPLTEGQLITAHYFLLGNYAGLRQSDWMRFNYASFIQGDKIILRAKKNGELVSFVMHDLLKAIIEKLKDMPACPSLQATNDYLKAIAKIAGIDKNISSHTARHSFAIRCAELGISIETTAELMGITVKSCGYYYKVTNKKIDAEVQKWNKIR